MVFSLMVLTQLSSAKDREYYILMDPVSKVHQKKTAKLSDGTGVVAMIIEPRGGGKVLALLMVDKEAKKSTQFVSDLFEDVSFVFNKDSVEFSAFENVGYKGGRLWNSYKVEIVDGAVFGNVKLVQSRRAPVW